MKRLELHLADGLDRNKEPFAVVAEKHLANWPIGHGQGDLCNSEGEALANLLLGSLPGGTIVAMIAQLRRRYAAMNPMLDPFLDDELMGAALLAGRADR